jgi:hypothetical protein
MLKKSKAWFYVFSAVFIGLLWYFQSIITENLPYWDDFHGIMLPVFNLFSDHSIANKFSEFFSLNNEHRVVNDRIFTTLLYLIFGKFELKYLALLGFCNLIALFFIYLKIIRKHEINLWLFLPVVFLIFQAQYYEGLMSTMVPFQNFSVILYTYLAFYFLIFKKINRIPLGLLFATLALYSHGNGILTFCIGLLILMLNANLKSVLKWLLGSAIAIGLYFVNYQKPSWTSQDQMGEFGLVDRVKYGLEFLGAYIYNLLDLSTAVKNTSLYANAAVMFGLLLVLSFVLVFFAKYPISKTKFSTSLQALKYNPKDQFLLATLMFFAATAILIGYSRTGLPMFSRYTINSAFTVCSVYVFIIFSLKNTKLFAGIVSVFTFIMLLFSYYNATHIGIFKKYQGLTDGLNWQHQKYWVNQYSELKHIANLNPLLTPIYEEKKYIFPKTELDNFAAFKTTPLSTDIKLEYQDKYLVLKGKGKNKHTFFSLENSKNHFVFNAQNLRNPPLKYMKTGKFYTGSYVAYYDRTLLPSGLYTLYVLDPETSTKQIVKSDLTFVQI